MPAYFGKPNSLWLRYNRWRRAGVRLKVAEALRDDIEWLSVDRSCVRAAGAAAGAKKTWRGSAANRPRRWAASRGGFVTKIHAAVSLLGHAVALE